MAANPALQDASVVRSTRKEKEDNQRLAVASVFALFARWLRVSEMRRRLERLDDRMLRDIGFDPEQARREAVKPFWKPYTLARFVG